MKECFYGLAFMAFFLWCSLGGTMASESWGHYNTWTWKQKFAAWVLAGPLWSFCQIVTAVTTRMLNLSNKIWEWLGK